MAFCGFGRCFCLKELKYIDVYKLILVVLIGGGDKWNKRGTRRICPPDVGMCAVSADRFGGIGWMFSPQGGCG